MKNPKSNAMKCVLSLVLLGGASLLPWGCEPESPDNGNMESLPVITSPVDQKGEVQSPEEQNEVVQSPVEQNEMIQPSEDKTVMPPPVLPDKEVAVQSDEELTATPEISEPPAQTDQLQIDQLQVEQFSFTFHKESQQELCGDWDYFTYNGKMTISGRLVSQYPIDMTDPDFEMTIDTPLESYDLPAVYQRDDHNGDYVEKVIIRQGRGQVFIVEDFCVDDDELVYQDGDDETGTYENHGPLLSATFDLETGTFETMKAPDEPYRLPGALCFWDNGRGVI